GYTDVVYVDPTDDILSIRLQKASKETGLPVHVLSSPNFFLSLDDVHQFFPPSSHYSLTSFYVKQRQRMNILMNGKKPVGGKWTFDTDNRRRFDGAKPLPPKRQSFASNPYVQEAKQYVHTYFPDNPGYDDDFLYPTNHAEAHQFLRYFLQYGFVGFGPYEDAIVQSEHFLFHSVLTPALNIGLLSPHEIIHESLSYAHDYKIPLQSVEGFVRQIVGWREFMRAIYLQEGRRMRNSNVLGHTRKLPKSFWNASTGILPIDNTIQKVLRIGYCHHIERLMILGNFMLLCEIHPHDVYEWFMSLFVDAYDWVMVPNVYGMSQYADGGLITTKPYVSSSRYIASMSDYPAGDWCAVWDSLYWRFIARHKERFLANPRMAVMARVWEKKSDEERNRLLGVADRYLSELDAMV
ncbi:MAG: cryptochrome/photolyase family protein, partial [Patescibacteria group bacterium]|nr:cryptochrome/photolyase family protein [Patescibacteria group bacterium]